MPNKRVRIHHHVGLQVSVEGEHHEKAVELLKAAPASVKLVVRYTPKVYTEENCVDRCGQFIISDCL